MQYKKWYVFVLVCTLSFFLIEASFSFIVDYAGLFGFVSVERFNKYKTNSPNWTVTKFYYINRIKPDAILLGTSRAISLDTKYMEEYIGGKVYNLALPASSIYEQYMYFKYMVENQNIKEAVVSLDLFAFNPNKTKKYSLDNRGFDENRLNRHIFIKDYIDNLISKNALVGTLMTVKNNYNMNTNHITSYETGVLVNKQINNDDEVIKNIRNTIESAVKDEEYYNSPSFLNQNSIYKSIGYLSKIIEVARANNIKLRFYISPIYKDYFDMKYILGYGNTYEVWKREIALLTDYYDFTGHNTVTSDKHWWYDAHHVITNTMSKLIFARLYNDHTVPVPKDFGVLVTKDNIDTHIVKLRAQVEKHAMKEILSQ
ncbi:MAG: hypothetical protein HQL06_03765 [Nitrospirae bacterium]|nr:hypothetical protein [Nitrospirota bacterium]